MIPSDAERRLLDYWWHHDSLWDKGGRDLNSAPMVYAIVSDLRLALAAACPEQAHVKCEVDHDEALRQQAHPPLDATSQGPSDTATYAAGLEGWVVMRRG